MDRVETREERVLARQAPAAGTLAREPRLHAQLAYALRPRSINTIVDPNFICFQSTVARDYAGRSTDYTNSCIQYGTSLRNIERSF